MSLRRPLTWQQAAYQKRREEELRENSGLLRKKFEVSAALKPRQNRLRYSQVLIGGEKSCKVLSKKGRLWRSEPENEIVVVLFPSLLVELARFASDSVTKFSIAPGGVWRWSFPEVCLAFLLVECVASLIVLRFFVLCIYP
jgi:hypothetical protein